ncbi:MAG: ferrous iron transport protein A [Dehalococcoidales bacterium]|nr:ferrous iron transport protein A [Dehalococcoidales bacterium]
MVVKPLSELQPPEKGRITRVGGKGEIRRRLLDMGVVTGAEVEVERVAPLGDPVQIKVKGYDLALRKQESENIQVELTESLLSRVSSGEKVTVLSLRAGWGLQRRLADLGITPGMEIKVISSGRPGQVVLNVRGSRLALGRGVASKIMVRTV